MDRAANADAASGAATDHSSPHLQVTTRKSHMMTFVIGCHLQQLSMKSCRQASNHLNFARCLRPMLNM